jgi:hypothetical protein
LKPIESDIFDGAEVAKIAKPLSIEVTGLDIPGLAIHLDGLHLIS